MILLAPALVGRPRNVRFAAAPVRAVAKAACCRLAGGDQLYGDVIPEFSNLTNVVRGADRSFSVRITDWTPSNGLDTIFDFEDGRDRIVLTAAPGFAQVMANASQTGSDVVIDLGAAAGGVVATDIVTIKGLVLANLNAADFLFV